TQGLNPVAYGGETEVVETSGKTGKGIEDLIEILDLQSQILELRADPTAPARGIVIEARVDQGLGSVATVLVQDGTLRVGDVDIASASGAVIIGFHVVADAVAAAAAEARRVEVRTYRVIYEIFDDLKKALSGMLEPEIREKHHGWVEIRQVFKVSRVGNIGGC